MMHDDAADDTEARDGTFEGRTFPTESEWLEAQLSHDEAAEFLSEDVARSFVERTMAALRAPGPDVLAAFAPPPPSADFVARTVATLQADRRERWRELLARYVAPEPSQEFVTRTLRALADESTSERPATVRHMSWWRTWSLPLLAAAAVLAVAFWPSSGNSLSIELRATATVPVAFGPAHAASPLPALLAALDRGADPDALENIGGDGVWLLLGGSKR